MVRNGGSASCEDGKPSAARHPERAHDDGAGATRAESELNAILSSLASVLLVSLVSLFGLLTLAFDESRARRVATFFIAFAVGVLLGDAFIHLIPASFAGRVGRGEVLGRSLLLLGGILAFFVVEKLLRHTHGPLYRNVHRIDATEADERRRRAGPGGMQPELAGPQLGLTTTLAVLLHEVPQEIGDFSVLVHSGLSVRRAALLNLASAAVAIVGTLLALFVGSFARDSMVATLLPVTAGGFVYLAAADLIPELQHDRSLRGLLIQTAFIILGVGLMGLLALWESH